MARRSFEQRNQWNTWSRMRSQGPAKVDLCKINTDALRHMTADQLQLAQTRAGWGMLPKPAVRSAQRPEGWRKIPRHGDKINALLARYIQALREVRSPLYLSDDNIAEFWKRNDHLRHETTSSIRGNLYNYYVKEREALQAKREAAIRAFKAERDPRREAERIEQQIWELQARAGCSIRDAEQVARDAAREGRRDAAARIRKKAVIR